jgi:hypothetical protein
MTFQRFNGNKKKDKTTVTIAKPPSKTVVGCLTGFGKFRWQKIRFYSFELRWSTLNLNS